MKIDELTDEMIEMVDSGNAMVSGGKFYIKAYNPDTMTTEWKDLEHERAKLLSHGTV